MTWQKRRDSAAEASRADAGLSQNTDQAAAYESGFESGWTACREDVLKNEELADVIKWAREAEKFCIKEFNRGNLEAAKMINLTTALARLAGMESDENN